MQKLGTESRFLYTSEEFQQKEPHLVEFEAQFSWLDGSLGATDVLHQRVDMRELSDCHRGFPPAPYIPSLVLAKSALHLKLIEMGLTVNLSTETPVI